MTDPTTYPAPIEHAGGQDDGPPDVALAVLVASHLVQELVGRLPEPRDGNDVDLRGRALAALVVLDRIWAAHR